MSEKALRVPVPVRRTLEFVSAVAAVVSILYASGLHSAFVGSQGRYLVHLVADSEGAPLARDALARSADPAPMLTAVLKPFTSLFGTHQALTVLWVLSAGLFFAALLSLSGRHGRSHPSRLLIWTAVMSLLALPVSQRFLADVHSGFDGLTSPLGLSSYFSADSAVVVGVLGCVIAIRRQWRLEKVGLGLGVLLVVIAGAFNPGAFVGLLVVACSLLSAEIWGRRSSGRRSTSEGSYRRAGLAAATALLAVVVVVLVNHESFFKTLFPGSTAADILVADHGLIPELGLLLVSVAALLLIGVAAALALTGGSEPERRLARVLVSGGLLTSAAVIVVWLVDSPSLSLLAPWRAAAVLVPLSVAYVAGRLAHLLVHEVRESVPANLGMHVVGLAVVLMAVVAGMNSSTGDRSEPIGYPKIASALQTARVDGTGLIPPGLSEFRLNVGARVNADLANHPIGAAAIKSWSRRVKVAEDAMASSKKLCDLLKDESFEWVVMPLDVGAGAQRSCLAAWHYVVEQDDLVLAIAP